MALTTYAELQTAIQTELERTDTAFTTATPDLIKRAEVKINRKLRLREMEQLAYATYAVGTSAIEDRLIALPTGYIELIHLYAKTASDSDDEFEVVQYVDPGQLPLFYTTQTEGKLRYTLRDQIEFNRPVSAAVELMMHYLKKWDIASDSTNWLLTNYPDVYLYGSLAEAEVFRMNDERIVLWKSLFEQGMAELDALSERGRDDHVLSTCEFARMTMQRTWNINTD